MIGKVNDNFFTKAILPATGAANKSVIVGPAMGVDAAVLKIDDQYMVIAEDPIFPSPQMSPEDFGWITVHIGASDVAVMGVKPQFMTYSLLMPPEIPQDYITRLAQSISDSAEELGISIVGGHTGYYGAVTVPTIGGITVWGLDTKYITPAGAKAGDMVLITKGTAIEAAALLGAELKDRLREAGIAENLIDRAAARMKEVTVVQDALIAAELPGVHAMHDATEGGLARGVWEIAEASGTGLRIERQSIMIPPDIEAVCGCFALNPYEVISEGTLVLSAEASAVPALLDAYQKAGLPAAVIGEIVPAAQGRFWLEEDGRTTELKPPSVDHFWEVFFSALS